MPRTCKRRLMHALCIDGGFVSCDFERGDRVLDISLMEIRF